METVRIDINLSKPVCDTNDSFYKMSNKFCHVLMQMVSVHYNPKIIIVLFYRALTSLVCDSETVFQQIFG